MSNLIASIPAFDWLIEPLQYGFLVQAIWVSAFVGLVCAVLSCYITLKGWSLMGDAVSHAVVPGVVIAYAFKYSLRYRRVCLWFWGDSGYWLY